MNDTDFFSANSYLLLPTRKNPKVALAVDNESMAKNAFKLYNPFSQKAKILKKITETTFTKANTISKIIIVNNKKEKSDFINYLEKKLSTPLISSLYFATANDKVVMQLQTLDAKIVGYVKYPLNDIGLRHLANEQRALEILSQQKIVKPYLLDDTFEDKPFLLFEALEGKIGLVERSHVDELLKKFSCEQSYLLSDHPRIKELEQALNTLGFSKYCTVLKKLVERSTDSYALVYEHGDFAPWNIIRVDSNYVPFDFEYFVENGLEYFDLIKYYYQIGKLLKRIHGEELIVFIENEIGVKEISLLIQLFLIKEIIRKEEEQEFYEFEVKMLDVMERK